MLGAILYPAHGMSSKYETFRLICLDVCTAQNQCSLTPDAHPPVNKMIMSASEHFHSYTRFEINGGPVVRIYQKCSWTTKTLLNGK